MRRHSSKRLPIHAPVVGRSAVFLDRDGVLIENRDDYVKVWEEARLLPGVLDGMRRLADSAHVAVIVTNQSAVGRGLMSFEAVAEINRRLTAAIHSAGGHIDACYVCPHTPADGCNCRKPGIGLLVRARNELGLDLARSYLVGDAASDMQAAQSAGVRPLLVLTGRGAEQVTHLGMSASACRVLPDLPSALDVILGRE